MSTDDIHRPGYIHIFDSLNYSRIDFLLASIMCEQQDSFLAKLENAPQQKDYCIYPDKRPGGVAFFKRGAIIRGQFSKENSYLIKASSAVL